jgi:hypothetical protein
MSKLWNHLKGVRWSIDGFSNLLNECMRSIAKESRALANVRDSVGFESHQTRAGCVRSNWVI